MKDPRNPTIQQVEFSMKLKFDKYWGIFEVVNKLIFLGNVLDLRMKLQMLQISFGNLGANARKKDEQSVKIFNEVDKYLEDPFESPLSKQFNILNWWKGKQTRFPILSQVAKDIFAIPSYTVASENAFSRTSNRNVIAAKGNDVQLVPKEFKWRSHNGVNGVAQPLGSHGNRLRGPLELRKRPLGVAH
ncbi:unnamed protein product, partial [Prunus brigantina]